MALATALGWCDGPESARDVCQEAFLVAWRRLPALREPAAFGGWLKRLVRTQCSRVRRRRSASAGLRKNTDIAQIVDRSSDTEELVSRREMRQRIRRAVSALPA